MHVCETETERERVGVKESRPRKALVQRDEELPVPCKARPPAQDPPISLCRPAHEED